MSENYNDKLQELLNTQKAMEDAKKDPQNTEITKVLTFYIGEQVYGIEIPDVIEIIEVPPITAVPGLIVDSVADVIPVTEQHISKTPELTGVNSNKFIKSILEMNDGIKLVLDVSKLIDEHASEEMK